MWKKNIDANVNRVIFFSTNRFLLHTILWVKIIMNNNGYRVVVDAGHLGTKFPKNKWDVMNLDL